MFQKILYDYVPCINTSSRQAERDESRPYIVQKNDNKIERVNVKSRKNQ